MKSIKNHFQNSLVAFLVVIIISDFGIFNHGLAQCDPTTIDLCEIGNNSIIQASFHAQIAKTSNGYSITGENFAPNGINYSTALTNIPGPNYPMPAGVVPVWGAIGGRTQAVFIATDSKIYAIGEEDLMIDDTRTISSAWSPTTLDLPLGITVCDINKWQGSAGSGSENNSNTTGDKDGFLVFSTESGDAYITGDGAKAIQSEASNTDWTMIDMPSNVSVANFGVGYRTLFILGSDGNLYTSGPNSYLGDGAPQNLATVTILNIQPDISIFGISQIEAGYNSYFVLDGDGTIHVLGKNAEGALGAGSVIDIQNWSKVGMNCSGGILKSVAYISTMSTHDNRISSSAILVDGTIRSWGSNNKQSITSGDDMIISCPVKPPGNNKNAVAISNGGHISPFVNTNVQICNIGHNRQGAFGDGNDEEGDYGEYKCRVIPGMPEICGTKAANLSLDKTVSDLSPSTGDDIIFTITVTNNGPEPSTGSFVRDQLKSGFYYLSDDANGDYNSITGLWVVGPLEVGESSSLAITVKVIESGFHTNYAQILVDNEVDENSTPGNSSANEDDDDTVVINVTPCPSSSSDILLCPGDSISIGNDWIYQSGLYVETTQLTIDCDSLHLTNVRYVENPPTPQLVVDCDELYFQISIDPSTTWLPTWGNGDNTYQTIYYGTDDQITLSLENAPSCVELSIIELPPFANIEEIPTIQDTTILENSLLVIDVGLNTLEWQIEWSPEYVIDCVSCMVGNIIADESTRVTMYLEHISGCTYESSFFLNIEKEPEHLFVPNVFSPNSYSSNKEWYIFTTPNILIEETSIYDRWGNLVFRSNDANPNWDGRLNEKNCVQGVYIYLIKYKDSDDMNQVTYGDLTLIR